MNESILIVESANMPKNSEVIFERLMAMLETTGRVKDRECVEADVKARDWATGSVMQSEVVFHHAKTDGVSGFCAAVIMYPGDVVHGVFAWPENSDDNLQRIVTVFEQINKLQLKRAGVKAA